MGQSILDYAVTLLRDGGIRAEVAQPAGNLMQVTEPVAAVSLEEMDQEKQTVGILVEIVGPKELGGALCQLRALDVCTVLKDAGAVCSLKSCELLNKGGLFRVPVKAVFRGTAQSDSWTPMPKCEIYMGQTKLAHVVSFSAEQMMDEGHISLENAPWEFALEEFFPWGAAESPDITDAFILTVRGPEKAGKYQNCKVTWRQRIVEERGIRQSRGGTASGRTEN